MNAILAAVVKRMGERKGGELLSYVPKRVKKGWRVNEIG